MNTILVVDDKKDMCETLERNLKESGYRVITTTQPQEVMSILDREEVDVLVTDLQMPGLTGLELLQRVKAKNPHISVLVMTAYASVEVAVNAMKNGAFDFLIKPFSMLELYEHPKIYGRKPFITSPQCLCSQSLELHYQPENHWRCGQF